MLDLQTLLLLSTAAWCFTGSWPVCDCPRSGWWCSQDATTRRLKALCLTPVSGSGA